MESDVRQFQLSRFLTPNRPGGFAANLTKGARSAPGTSAENASQAALMKPPI
jgi:hypothetical protein